MRRGFYWSSSRSQAGNFLLEFADDGSVAGVALGQGETETGMKVENSV